MVMFLFVTKFQIAYVQPIRQLDGMIDHGCRDFLISRDHSAGIDIR